MSVVSEGVVVVGMMAVVGFNIEPSTRYSKQYSVVRRGKRNGASTKPKTESVWLSPGGIFSNWFDTVQYEVQYLEKSAPGAPKNPDDAI